MCLNTIRAEVASVQIPRFKFEFGMDMSPLLQKLGLVKAFENGGMYYTIII